MVILECTKSVRERKMYSIITHDFELWHHYYLSECCGESVDLIL